MIAQLQQEMSIVLIDTDISYNSAETWKIKNIPTVLILQDSVEQGRLVGSAINASEIRRLYKQ
jgi:hypothetical protein